MRFKAITAIFLKNRFYRDKVTCQFLQGWQIVTICKSTGNNVPGVLNYQVLLLLLLSAGLPVANAPDVLQPCGLLYYS